jgi:hypothetical protein
MVKIPDELIEKIHDNICKQENEALQVGIKSNTAKNRKKIVEISNLKREVQSYIPRFNMD